MEPALIQHISSRDAEFALERARTDAEWLATLRGAYAGRHEVLDALWWVAHPLTATPGGLADPAQRLRELQRAVFSREGTRSPIVEVVQPDGGTLRMREAERELWQVQRSLAEDARCLQLAWLAASSPLPTHPAEPGPERDAVGEARQDDPDPAAPDPADPTARPRRKLLPAIAGIGLLAAILVLPTLTGLDAGAENEPNPSPTTPRTTPHARTEIVTIVSDGHVSDPLSVLLRPAAESDKPRLDLEHNHQPGSFRRLPDMVGNVELYVARGEQADTICLVAVRAGGAGMSSCVPEATYAKKGIQLGSSGDRYQAGHLTILTESFTLLPNGDFHYQATARASLDPAEIGADSEPFLGS